jgi:hypothetical protein
LHLLFFLLKFVPYYFFLDNDFPFSQYSHYLFISPLKLWVWIPHMVRCTRYNIMWWSLSVTCGRSVVFRVSSTNKTDCHDITEILLKVVLITITLTIFLMDYTGCWSQSDHKSNTTDVGSHLDTQPEMLRLPITFLRDTNLRITLCLNGFEFFFQTYLEQSKTKFNSKYQGMNLSKITATVGLNSK